MISARFEEQALFEPTEVYRVGHNDTSSALGKAGHLENLGQNCGPIHLRGLPIAPNRGILTIQLSTAGEFPPN